MWGVFILDIFVPGSFAMYGMTPRTLRGLLGIATSPFLHGGLFHLIANTMPLFILLLLFEISYPDIAGHAVCFIIIVGGFLCWLIARPAIHIGASSLIYGLAGFLIVAGIYKRRLIPLFISIFVACTYGLSLLFGIIPIPGCVSWEGHLTGLVSGVLLGFSEK